MSSTPVNSPAGSPLFRPRTVGTIEAIGRRAAQRWGLAECDRVAVEVFQSCRECDSGLGGEYRRCVRHGRVDMYGFISVDREPGLSGGYAEYHISRLTRLRYPCPTA